MYYGFILKNKSKFACSVYFRLKFEQKINKLNDTENPKSNLTPR